MGSFQPNTPDNSQNDADGAQFECFICCSEGGPRDELVKNVCACRTTAMHVRCQKQMLEAALAQSPSFGVRCRVCREHYRNADIHASWYLSWIGLVWLTLPLAMGILFLSAIFVLSQGDAFSRASPSYSRAIHPHTKTQVIGIRYSTSLTWRLGWRSSSI